jgi:hypothetical protein
MLPCFATLVLALEDLKESSSQTDPKETAEEITANFKESNY